MRILSLIMLLLIVSVGLSFAYFNAELVTIHYYIGSLQLPLSILIALCIALGGAMGLLVALKTVLKLKRIQYQLNHKLKSAEKELASVRNRASKENH